MELFASDMKEVDFTLLQQVFNAMPDLVVVTDNDGRIVTVNSSFGTIFGYSEKEIVGKKTDLLYASRSDYEQVAKTKFNPSRDTKSSVYEIEYKRKDGSSFTGETVDNIIKDASGSVVGYIAAIRDLTIQKKNEKYLKKLFERLQLLVKITTVDHSKMDEQITEALKLATELLDLEVGIVSRITDDNYTVKYYYPEESELEKGMVFDLGNTYCDITYEADDVVLIDHMGSSVYEGHPCYQHFELESYMGVPLVVGGVRYGTLNFSSTEPSEPFDKADKATIRLLGEWLSATIERQIAEDELRQSQEKFRLISKHSADLVCLHAADGTYEYVSPSVVDILGYTPEDLTGMDPYLYIHPDDIQNIRENSHKPATQGHRETSIQYRIKKKNGTYIWFETSTEPIVNNGKVKKLCTVSRDITDRKNLQLLLMEAERMAQVGGWELDLESGALYWTDEVYRIHELPLDTQLEVEEAIDFYPDEAKDKIQELVKRAVEEASGYDIELPLNTANGNRKWVRAIGRVQQDASRNVYKLYGVFQDLTQRKAMEDQLREQNEELKRLHETTNTIYSVLGHDLRSPLNAIIGFSDYVSTKLEAYDIDPKLLKFLDNVTQSSIRMSGMVDDLSKWARMQTGDLKLKINSVSLKDLILKMLELLKPAIEEKNIDVLLTCDDNLMVDADSQLISTIVRNFTSNAIKFSDWGSNIEIDCSIEDSYWTISVRDEGTGMTKETLEDLFGSNHPSTYGTNREEGSGIGLTLCYQLAQLHNGDIIVNSEVDMGSEFILKIPIS